MSSDDTGRATPEPDPAELATRSAARKAWSLRRVALTTAAAVALVAIGAGGTYAVMSVESGGTGATSSDDEQGAPAIPPDRSLMDALHGQFVTSNGKGGTTTEFLQTGKVTAFDTNSITVVSTDSYIRTYRITSSTAVDGSTEEIAAIKTGDVITAVAAQSGAATEIQDRTLTQPGHRKSGAPPTPGPHHTT